MDLQQYISRTEKQYHLRLKTIIPLDEVTMDRIESCVAKYLPLAISAPMKTILQSHPLDFPNVNAAEVYVVNMTFGLPAAPHVIRADIRKVLDAPENYVFVRNWNEPGEIETERLNALADIELEAERRGLKPAALLLDPDYSEADHDHQDLYGTDYNVELLNYLAKVEDERHEVLSQVESAPFKWLPLADRDAINYNADIKDAPFATRTVRTKPDITQKMLGNFDPSRGEVRRSYIDGNGKRVVLTRSLAVVGDPK